MGKSITKNYIYNLIYQIMIVILPIVTTPYVSRVLGANGIGIFGYTLSIVTYFILFGSLGISIYGQREIACVRDDKSKMTKTFVEIFSLKLITMLISTTIFFITFALGEEYNTYYKIYLLEFISNIIDITWFFQGLEEFKKIAIRNIIVKIISVICIFTFVKTVNDLYLYILIYCLSNIFGNGVLWIKLKDILSKINIKELNIVKHLKPAILLFVPQIAIQIYTVLDKTMMGNILNDMSVVGNYEQSQKIVKLVLTLITALGTVAAPRIAYNYFNGKKDEVNAYLKKSFNFVWFLGIPACFGLIAIASNFIPWFLGKEYTSSIMLVQLGSLLILAIGLNNITGVQYLISVKKQNVFTSSVILGALINFVLNLILIPIYKATGAMISSVIAESIILIVQLIYLRKHFSLKIVFGSAPKYVISGIIMFMITYIVGQYMQPNINTTMIQILIGMIVYVTVLLIMRDGFLLSTIKMATKKILNRSENI